MELSVGQWETMERLCLGCEHALGLPLRGVPSPEYAQGLLYALLELRGLCEEAPVVRPRLSSLELEFRGLRSEVELFALASCHFAGRLIEGLSCGELFQEVLCP